MAANDPFGAVLRAGRGSARQQSGADLTRIADQGLDRAMEGLASLHAAIDALTDETGEEPEGTAPFDVEEAFEAAGDALTDLRDAVDDALVSRGLDPTTAAELEADGAEE